MREVNQALKRFALPFAHSFYFSFSFELQNTP